MAKEKEKNRDIRWVVMKKLIKIPIIILILIPIGGSIFFLSKSLDHGEYFHDTYSLPANQWAVYNITFKPGNALSIDFHNPNYDIPWWFVNLSQFSIDLNSLDKSNFSEVPTFGYIEKNCYHEFVCFQFEYDLNYYFHTEQTPRHRINSYSNFIESGEYAIIVNNTYNQNKEIFISLYYHIGVVEWTLSLMTFMFSYPLLLFMLFVVYKDENIIKSVKILVASRRNPKIKSENPSINIHFTKEYVLGSGFIYKLVEERNNRIGKLLLSLLLFSIILISLITIAVFSQKISGY